MANLDFPFHYDERGRSASTDDADHIRDLIYQVLLTSPGERVMRPSFGSGLLQLVFAPNSVELAATTQMLAQAALQQWLSTCAGETPDVQIYCRPLLDVDYLTQWQQFFQPRCIGERLMIRPPWDTSPVPATMACLTLNPGPAFGTGTHPSTHLCLLMLLQYAAQCQGSKLLDVGCGSGILSLAALQLGWQSAVGVDIDAQAIAVATHNAELNGLQDRAQFLHGSWQSVTGIFPCITANIYLGPLVEMLQPLTRYLAPGGTIILSGLLATQEATMRTAVQNAGLAVQARRGEEEWVALAVRRARDVEQEPFHV